MSYILFGVELPRPSSGSGGGAADPFTLAFAQNVVPLGEVKTIPDGFKYIQYRDFTIEGTVVLEGELVIL